MKKFLKEIFSGTELVGTINLISGIIMALLWSYFSSRWWSVVCWERYMQPNETKKLTLTKINNLKVRSQYDKH